MKYIYYLLIGIVLVNFQKTEASLIDEHCTVNMLNRAVNVASDGGWSMPNVPSTMGSIRARVTCVRDGVTTAGQTDFFTVERDGVVDSGDFVFEAADPPPALLEITPSDDQNLTGVGDNVSLKVIATFPDGSSRDVTLLSEGTNYSSTNPSIATINDDGVVTAMSSGTVLITARLDGAVALKSIMVTTSGDTDGDGLADDLELANGLNPNDPVDAIEDFDNDGLTNRAELLEYGTEIRNIDTDADSISDGEEVILGNDSFITSPLLPDTDGDGVRDALEITTGSDPTDAASLNLAEALASLEIQPVTLAITFNTIIGEASRTVSVLGLLDDGYEIDLTSTASGTNYTSSDLSICSFGLESGRIFAGANGQCEVTASNSGFSDKSMVTVNSFAPTPLSTVSIPGFANNVDVSGDYAFVAAGSAGLQVIDVSLPSSPLIVASLDTPGDARDVKVVADIVFIADAIRGLHLIDISDRIAPKLIGTGVLPCEAEDVALGGNFAYVACGSGGLQIVDVGDPSSPEIAGSIILAGFAYGVDVSNGVVAVAAGTSGVHIISVSSPTVPSLLATVSGGDVRDLVITDNALLLADVTTGFRTIDISDPASPIVGAATDRTFGGLLLDVASTGRFAVGADIFFINGVPIIDVSDPANPNPRAILDFSAFRDDDGTGIATDGNYIYLTAAVGSDSRLYIGQYLEIEDFAEIPPNIEFVAPTGGGEFVEGSSLPIVVKASDDVGIDSVEFLVDDITVATDTSEPYEVSLTLPSAVSTLTLSAVAVDFGGNQSRSAEVVISVVPDPLTTAVGDVVDDIGNPVEGASVLVRGQTGTTNVTGDFSISNVPTITESIRAIATAQVGDLDMSGVSASMPPVRGGLTDLGRIELQGLNLEGLLAYYPFNGNANDESGNGRDGSVMGATLTEDRLGTPESAYNFNGSAWIKAVADGLPTGERTVAFWFSPNNVPASRPFSVPFSYGGGSCGSSWFQEIRPTDLNVHRHCGNSPVFCAVDSVPVGQWTHWATTTSAAGTKIYVNGVEVCSSSTFINNTTVAGTQLSIGVSVNSSGTGPYTDINITYFNGIIDEVLIYDRELSSTELSLLALP